MIHRPKAHGRRRLWVWLARTRRCSSSTGLVRGLPAPAHCGERRSHASHGRIVTEVTVRGEGAARERGHFSLLHDSRFSHRGGDLGGTTTELAHKSGANVRKPGADVIAVLERVFREIGCPKTIRLDNGPEFVSRELDLWAFMRGVTLDFSRPGKPTDNAFIESLNGKFRAECLNANWFLSLDEARRKCEAWRRDYNEVRPHSAIGNQVPAMLHRLAGNPGQAAVR